MNRFADKPDDIDLTENGIATAFGSDLAWRDWAKKVLVREYAVELVQTRLGEHGYFAKQEIASTDIFVEKAEDYLEKRSKQMKRYATSTIFAFPINIGIFLSFYILNFDFFNLGELKTGTATQSLIGSILKNSTFIGIFLAAQYLIGSLFRAFMHESTALDNRIHSLRLGRLYIYLKYASIDKHNIEKIRTDISAKDLVDAFGWNIETSTAFKDIDAKQLSRSWHAIFSDLVGAIKR